MKPVKKASISNQVFEKLKDQIVNGKWQPGTKIPSENELTKILEVSRMTVRQALQKLVTLGLLETRQGEGTYVKKFSADTYLNSLIPFFVLDGPETLNVLEYRKIVEIGTVGLVVERATDEDICKLKEILKHMHQNRDNIEEFAEEDLNFHLALARITRNPVIIKVNFIIKDVLSASMARIVKSLGTSDGLFYHGKILEAIENRDKQKAQRLMEEHVIKTIDRIKKED